MDRIAITPGEAAKMFSVSRSTIYRAIRRGDMPAVRVGQAARIPLKALSQWVEAQLERNEQARGFSGR